MVPDFLRNFAANHNHFGFHTFLITNKMSEISTHTVNEPTLSYGSNSYTDVMSVIHSMPISRKVKQQVALRLVQEVTEPALAEAFDKLDELGRLREGWDGEGALPISAQVMKNMKDVMLISNNSDWENWMFGPEVNACIGLQSKGSGACVSLGGKEFSYFAIKDGKRIAASHVEFSPTDFLETLRQIG